MIIGSQNIVHFVEPKPVGFRYPIGKNCPPHITLLPWYFTEYGEQPEMLDDLQRVVQQEPPIEVCVGNSELFGPGKDIPVNVLTDRLSLKGLHMALLGVIESHGAEFQLSRTYVGRSYRPHITDGEKYRGSVLTVGEVALVGYSPDKFCTVQNIFQLGQRFETAA